MKFKSPDRMPDQKNNEKIATKIQYDDGGELTGIVIKYSPQSFKTLKISIAIKDKRISYILVYSMFDYTKIAEFLSNFQTGFNQQIAFCQVDVFISCYL